MEPILVIMAAGMGSRYGGNKQLDKITEQGDIIMDFSIYDAWEAGFRRVCFIIKHDFEEVFKEHIENGAGRKYETYYAFQEGTDLPEGFTLPEGRTKPWGTGQAVLSARDIIDAPFAVINADDYYGAEAYRMMYEELLKLPAEGQAVMVGYQLNRTASLHGTVSRGVCTMEDGKLVGIRETKKIQMYPDGSLRDLTRDRPLAPDSVVSMNFWGFAPSIFSVLKTYFEDFLRHQAGEDLTAECLLPVMVDHEMKAGELEVTVLRSGDRWFGMTYQEDRMEVAERLKQLHREGVYPASLRE